MAFQPPPPRLLSGTKVLIVAFALLTRAFRSRHHADISWSCLGSIQLNKPPPDHAASSQWQPTVIPEPTIQCGLRQGSGHCWSTDVRHPTSLGRTGEGVWGTPRAIGRALFQAKGCFTPHPNYRLDRWCGSLNKVPQRP